MGKLDDFRYYMAPGRHYWSVASSEERRQFLSNLDDIEAQAQQERKPSRMRKLLGKAMDYAEPFDDRQC